MKTIHTGYILMFPGQGAQRIGMGADLFAEFSIARDVFAEVDEALGVSLSRSMFSGDVAFLTQTFNAQPALLAHSVAAARVLAAEHGVAPKHAVLGHSVGEYAALVFGGALGLAAAARLLRVRGGAMQAAADRDTRGAHAMVAVLYTGAETLTVAEAAAREACSRACSETAPLVASLAAVNAPTQLVLSGHAKAIDVAIAHLKTSKLLNVRRAVPLNVSAPFHSPTMLPASAALRAAFAVTPFLDLQTPLVSGYAAKPITKKEDLIEALISGVDSPVRWAEAVSVARTLAGGDEKGYDDKDGGGEAQTQPLPHFLELGPGTTLGAFVRAIYPKARVSSVGTSSDVRGWKGV